MKLEWRRVPAALAVAGLVGMAATARADVADFYKGKQVRIVVGSSAGGGFDAFARLVGRNMGRYIPGEPRIVVSNLPGAGSMKAVQSIKAQAPDGTYMVEFNAGQILNSLLQPKKVRMKFDEVAFVGSGSADARVCSAWHTTGVKTFEDLLARKKPFATGHTSATAATYIDAAILKNVFGAPIKQIVGFPGSTEAHLAVERGELDGDCVSWDSVPVTWIRDKKAYVFIRISKVTAPGIENVPFVGDFAKTQEQKQIINLLTAHNRIFRPFIAAKDTPPDRLKALRDGFWNTVTGAPFLADARKANRLVISPMRGEEVEQVVAEFYQTPASIIPKAAKDVK